MKQRILHLSLKKEPFEVMVTGEKVIEFRIVSKWITSRLENKDGSPKEYDVIKFTNGYGKNRPSFVCIYEGFQVHTEEDKLIKFSNGLKVLVKFGMYKIYCGNIGIKRNIKDEATH